MLLVPSGRGDVDFAGEGEDGDALSLSPTIVGGSPVVSLSMVANTDCHRGSLGDVSLFTPGTE